jgi:hypothetical protein
VVPAVMPTIWCTGSTTTLPRIAPDGQLPVVTTSIPRSNAVTNSMEESFQVVSSRQVFRLQISYAFLVLYVLHDLPIASRI